MAGFPLFFGFIGKEIMYKGALAEDMALSIHAHPTLTETLGEAAERFLGSSTHILPSKR
jgi:dihydrolipoamide dehydrogenase